jgi:hypothetical protein
MKLAESHIQVSEDEGSIWVCLKRQYPEIQWIIIIIPLKIVIWEVYSISDSPK